MIQDIAPHIYNNAYQPRKIEKDDLLILCRYQREVFVSGEKEQMMFPTWGEATGLLEMWQAEPIYLFTIDTTAYFLLDVTQMDGELYNQEGYAWVAKGELRFARPQHQAFAAVTALQLANWYASRRFCGKCGHTMVQDMTERMMYCPVCKTMEYPKISPAVIVAVTDKNRLLLTKYAGRTYKKYALIAGFAEIGETIEETVQREVMEEVGMEVKNLRYYKSQPWSFSETLLFGFYAEVDGSTEIVLDQEELSEAEWFEREEIPVEYTGDSLTNEMIMQFKNGKE